MDRQGGQGLALLRKLQGRALLTRDSLMLVATILSTNNIDPLLEIAASMSATGTYRGTPKGRAQSHLSTESPSNIPIPRPKLENMPSEAGSSYSASRSKQSKRDEVLHNFGYE